MGNAALRKLQERNHAATGRFIERKFTKSLENRAVDLQRVIKSDKLQHPWGTARSRLSSPWRRSGRSSAGLPVGPRIPSSVPGRINPLHPATGFGPPAPLAAPLRQTRRSTASCCHPSSFIVIVRRITRPGFVNP
ncbi:MULTISPECIES: hypothetical protein [Burkholderia]|uniref:hypothetical protein n=1 Tax=Burkholderia TaxID=32008 RepID=UPI000F5421F7|nr:MULTISPECIES: hypothetical protein [Burkholderia]MCA8265953.1 hypothetical protein [Burkholderia vietnamiensis]MDN8110792.1 hypothetical protein [Burkholderia vietnamiensis]RQM55948.1 hypothetical protein EHZ18_18315 [Burkholderia vietnamiensis]UKV73059.1 hypothetical protein FOC29_04465 [Burkholderia vietnamiensis]HDR9025938.1 hypothetical protein [Burkholderia vietnamiensis]